MSDVFHDFDEEARKLFAALNLDPQRKQGYRDLDAIWRHPRTGGRVYVGNRTAASERAILTSHHITHVVNCTDSMPCFHERDPQMAYHRFHVSGWMLAIEDVDDMPTVADFCRPVWAFVESAVERGEHVLIHCLAGAHRAGTTGVMWLMYRENFDAERALQAARLCRDIIQPIGRLKRLLARYDRALEMRRSAIT